MTDPLPLVVPLSDARATDLSLVGGKGASLGGLARSGFPVPRGACVTTAAFAAFVRSVPGSADLYDSLDSLTADDVDQARRVAESVRTTLLGQPVPEVVADAVRQAWLELGPERAYAVRSSATAEDLPDASFAGQHETFLNVVGDAGLVDAVRSCWVSLFTDRAVLYRARNGVPHRDVRLAVVLQEMVGADSSGVLFTADPLTGHRHTLTIDAGLGLGEALVSGLISPESFRVDKRTGAVLERREREQAIAVVPAASGGTRQEALSREQQESAGLTLDQVSDLVELGRRVEEHTGSPQDVEWAIAQGQVHLLQARPITSLYPIDGLRSPDGSLHVYFSMGHQQSMTRAMAPLAISTIQAVVPLGRDPSGFGNRVVRSSGGRMYADLTVPLRHPLLRRAVLGLMSQFDVLAPRAVRQVVRRPEFSRPSGLRPTRPVVVGILRVARRVASALWLRDLTGFADRTDALIESYVADVRRSLEAAPPGAARLAATLAALRELPRVFLHWVPEAAAGILATRVLTRVARRWLTPDEVDALTLGVPGNVVNEMNLAIGDLAELARGSAPLRAAFAHLGEDGRAWLERAGDLDDTAEFLAAWESFLARYGARGPSEIDLSRPRWSEDPLPVLQVIAGFLDGEPDRHRAHQRSMVAKRREAMLTLRAAAGAGPVGWARVRVLDRLYRTMVQVGGMREHHKFAAVRVLAVVKDVLKEEALRLAAAGRLAHPQDIWFLTWDELTRISDGAAVETGLVERRRAELARHERLTPPLIITSDGESPVVRHRIDDAPAGALVGQPVSRGVVTGVVHVIRDPQRETLAPGEILVAEFTDPGWTPLFINAGGLVMEVGGSLTHGSVVAREYGVPAVVGVAGATSTLRTGESVRVDGDRGVVERLG